MIKPIRRVMPTTIYTGPGVSPFKAPTMSISYLRSKYMRKSSQYRSSKNLTGETDDDGRTLGPAIADWIIRDAEMKSSGIGYASVDDSECKVQDTSSSKCHVPYNYQYSLNLERIEDREEQLLRLIDKYERTFERLSMYALRWHYLMDDVENNTSISEMFESLQLLRRLSGGKVF